MITDSVADTLDIRKLCKVSVGRSVFKLTLYFSLLIGLAFAIYQAHSWYTIILLEGALGLVMAHGLELQHEALHHNMFRNGALNRFFGVLVGAPMMVSYTHYQLQHLHHHKYVGTKEDAELFNYNESDLNSVPRFLTRAWNSRRIPTFLSTYFKMLRHRYPTVATKPYHEKCLFQEYTLILLWFIAAVVGTFVFRTTLFLLIWLVPFMVFGELFHYFIELPEHLGCDKHDPEIPNNTRSIRTNPVIAYLVNGNNYHMEHHLYPKVAMHNLRRVHDHIFTRTETKTPTTYYRFFSGLLRSKIAKPDEI